MNRTEIHELFISGSEPAIPVTSIRRRNLKVSLSELDDQAKRWAEASKFKASMGEVLLIPNADGSSVGRVLFGVGDGEEPMIYGVLSQKLPSGIYRLDGLEGEAVRLAHTAFGLGAYRFNTYLEKPKIVDVQLAYEDETGLGETKRDLEASWLVRDLVNTPAEDMGPNGIEAAAREVAEAGGAEISVITGGDLLDQNFPMIHAVGRAADRTPRLIDIVWGDESAPKLTLVGKGVAYDTGGLNIKPGGSMRIMKKDMGGAAHVLGLAQMIMAAKLPVRLRVLIPAVENSISGNAFRPGDILQSRKGTTVEIGNTDAEGRLVLADALTLACEEEPDQVLDFATLTGAARVALGADLPPYYATDDAFAQRLNTNSNALHDPMWRMPLWQPYAKGLKSSCADLCNITNDGFAGSVTAALFLQHFVTPGANWTHFDIFAWTNTGKPQTPVGGEAQTIRAVFDALCETYC
ncbi:MAG: leucyl aminopeptidase family protein [Pseudomonadota bacterium]